MGPTVHLLQKASRSRTDVADLPNTHKQTQRGKMGRLGEKEINHLPDKEFKVMVTKMLIKLR